MRVRVGKMRGMIIANLNDLAEEKVNVSRQMTKWHYEYYPTKPDNGLPWRIGDALDDYVDRVATEDEARTKVREHNARVQDDPNWRY